MVGAGLLDAYEATFDRRWLDHSRALAEEALRLFWDEATGSLLRHRLRPGGPGRPAPEPLRQRGAERHLGGHRVAASGSPRTWARSATSAQALRALRPMADLMRRHPTGFGRLSRRAGLPPGAGAGDRAGLARRLGRRGRRGAPAGQDLRALSPESRGGGNGGRGDGERRRCRSSPASGPRPAGPPPTSAGSTCARRPRRTPMRSPASLTLGYNSAATRGRFPENRVRPGTPRT